MLSAVAARKAARAAAQTATTFSHDPSSPSASSNSPSLSEPPSTATTSKPSSKRKPPNARPSKSKKVKVGHAPAKPDRNTRYFDSENASNARSGTVHNIADDDSESSSSEDMEIEMNAPQPFVTKTRRAWSPSRPVPDSSDDDEPGLLWPVSYPTSSTSIKPEPLPLATFRPVPDHNIYPAPENECLSGGKAHILILQPNETLALVGTYAFCVLQGSVSLLGVTLLSSNTKHTVFAPRSSPIPILSWVATPDRQGSCTFPIPPHIRQQANTTAILVEHVDTGVEGLGRICRIFDNDFKPPRGTESDPVVPLPRIHIVNHSTKDTHPFVLPGSWETALASLEDQPTSGTISAPVCLVKGPKKSGKSTLARTLANSLLTRYRRVAFLECDLGQSEFTPGGLVALNLIENYVFGPPFTHPSLPYRAHYIGSTSPRASPSHYLYSIQALLETYRLDLQFPPLDDDSPGDQRIHDAIPLVVNTMGWSKGLGADLNARIEEFVDPSHTFQLEERSWPLFPQSRHVPRLLNTSSLAQTNKLYLEVEAIHPETTYQTAADHRHLNIISYFHAVFPELPTSTSLGASFNQAIATSWDTSLPLCARYPYEVDYMQAFDHVYLTGAGYEDVVPSELTRVLNGAIVGLVSGGPLQASPSTPSASEEAPLLSYSPGEPPPDPTLSTCHGLALIRGLPLTLGPHSPHMHVLTPLPAGLLAQTRVLVKGEMELPIWGMLDFREEDYGRVAGIEKGLVPYLQWGKGEGIGGERRRVRRNLMRKGQM